MLHVTRPSRTSSWVSKTDLTRYLRCPYAFYVVDRGLIPQNIAVNEPQARLIQEGVAFQAGIEAAAGIVIIEPGELRGRLAHESIRVFGVPVLENPGLEIYGQPDAVDAAEGARYFQWKSNRTRM